MFDYFCWNTTYYHIGRYIFHHNRIGSNDGIVTYRDIAENLCSAINGHIVAYRWAIEGIRMPYRHTLIHPTVLTDWTKSDYRSLAVLNEKPTINILAINIQPREWGCKSPAHLGSIDSLCFQQRIHQTAEMRKEQ